MTKQHDEASPDVSRRNVLRCAAVTGAAVPLLAACGGGSPGADPTSSGSSTGGHRSPGGGSSGGSHGPVVTLATSQVPVGGGKILAAQQVVVTQPKKGEFKAFSAICTHLGCTVAAVQQGAIICPCHGSSYSIKNGKVLGGPAPSPLPSKKVSVKGNQISVS
jgi:nitrite reductase/ring-hydroxylating ferredoxin subunit